MCFECSGANDRGPHRLSQRLAVDFFDDNAEQRVIGLAVLLGCARRKVGWVRERDGEKFHRLARYFRLSREQTYDHSKVC